MKNILIMLCFFQFLSCKKGVENSEIIKDNIFSVDLNVKIVEDDRLQLFYIPDDPESRFNAENRVFLDVKGASDFQTISFKLPSGVFPYRFRIDLGENNIESDIELNLIVIKLNDAEMRIDSAVFPRLFKPNIYLSTSDYKTFSRKTIEKKYDPYILSTPLLDKKIELEFY